MADRRAEVKRQAEELEAAADRRGGENGVRILKASFAQFDGGSGFLTAKEMMTILTKHTAFESSLSMEDAQSFIAEFDVDGDGKLDVNEFIVAMVTITDAYDGDGGGPPGPGSGPGSGSPEEDFAEKLAQGELIEGGGGFRRFN